MASLLALFTGDTIVHTPLFGPLPAAEFYPALFGDTNRASLTLHGVTGGTSPAGAPLVGLGSISPGASGRDAPFDVVVVLELSPDGQITSLHITYNTIKVRPAFEASA